MCVSFVVENGVVRVFLGDTEVYFCKTINGIDMDCNMPFRYPETTNDFFLCEKLFSIQVAGLEISMYDTQINGSTFFIGACVYDCNGQVCMQNGFYIMLP